MQITGVEALRRKAIACANKSGVLHALVRDIEGLGLTAIREFAVGRRDLKIELLQALAKEFFNAGLDADGMLYPLNPLVDRPLRGRLFTAIRSENLAALFSDRCELPRNGPQPARPEPPKEPTGPRPGWAA